MTQHMGLPTTPFFGMISKHMVSWMTMYTQIIVQFQSKSLHFLYVYIHWYSLISHFVVLGHAFNLHNITRTTSSVVWAIGLVRDPVVNTYTTSNRSSYFRTAYNTVNDAVKAFLLRSILQTHVLSRSISSSATSLTRSKELLTSIIRSYLRPVRSLIITRILLHLLPAKPWPWISRCPKTVTTNGIHQTLWLSWRTLVIRGERFGIPRVLSAGLLMLLVASIPSKYYMHPSPSISTSMLPGPDIF